MGRSCQHDASKDVAGGGWSRLGVRWPSTFIVSAKQESEEHVVMIPIRSMCSEFFHIPMLPVFDR
eukprot:5541780-Pyramimonas_sp.AAC.1